MNLKRCFRRVYIRISSQYDVSTEALRELNLLDLLKNVAKANPAGDVEPLYDVTSGEFYEKRTKRFVVRRVNNFIKGLHDAFCEKEDMADFASIKQLNLLVRAFSEGRKCISGFALVYVYIMYSSLTDKTSAAGICARYIRALHDLVCGYYEDHPEDEIAGFVDAAFEPIICAVETCGTVQVDALPGRPCRHPKQNVE